MIDHLRQRHSYFGFNYKVLDIQSETEKLFLWKNNFQFSTNKTNFSSNYYILIIGLNKKIRTFGDKVLTTVQHSVWKPRKVP